MNTQIASGSDARRTGLARNVRRTLSAVAALAATCALAPAALADPATAVTHQPYTGSNVSGTYTGGTATNQFAGVFSLTVTSEGATTETFAYCIALNVGGISGTYTEGDWATSGISNLGKVAWVLNNSFPQKTLAQLNAIDLDGDGTANDADEELESNATAAGATQASIWHFTNGFVPTSGFSAPQQALYNYLTTHAVDLVQPVPALDVKPETGVSGIAGSDVGPFTVDIVDGVATLSLDPAAAGFGIVDGAGNPVSTVGDGSGADSKDVFVRTPVGAASGSVNLTAVSNEVTLLAGRVFKQTGKQTLILAKSSTVKKDDFEVASYTAASFDAKVTKTVTSNAQGKIGYSIVAKNNGNVPATFSVTDQIPDGLMYLAADNAGNGWNAGDVNGPGSKSQSVTLAAGASKTLAIVLRYESADPAGNLRLCNTATAPTSVVVNGHTITESAGTQGDNSSQACTTVSPRYDLALRKTISSTLALGETTSSTVVDIADVVPFEIRVFNQGNMVASNITVTDHVPAGFAFVASLNPGWVDNGNGRVSRVIAGPLAPGAQTAVMLNLVVDGDAAPGNLLNIAEISSDNGDDVDSTTDLNPGNDVLIDDEITKTPATGDEDDHDVASVTLREFDLALRKTTTSVTVNPGDAVSFSITVFNQGQTAASHVVLVDYVPAGYEFVPSDNPAWTSGAGATFFTELPGTIAPGGEAVVTFVLRVNADVVDGSALVNTAEIASAADGGGSPRTDVDSTPDTDVANDVLIDDEITKTPATGDEDDHDIASVTVLVPPTTPPLTPPTTTPPTTTPPTPAPPLAGQGPKRAKLGIVKTAVSKKVESGATVRFTIRVRNTSKISATGVQVCDLLPAGLGYISSSRKASFKQGKLCWSVGTIKSKKFVTIAITAKVADASTGKLTNKATATANNAGTVSAKASITAKKPKQQVRGVIAVTG